MRIVAIEPRPEVADWLRLKARRLRVPIEVHAELGGALGPPDGGEIRYLVGYLPKLSGLPPSPGPGRRTVIPFAPGLGTTEDHCHRWTLFLQAVRGRMQTGEDGVGAREGWVAGREEEAMEARHRALLECLNPVFLELARRDPTAKEHSFRVGLYAGRIGEALGLEPALIRLLRLGGWVHDVGKIRIRAPLLRKSGPLEDDERTEIRGHTVWGARIVEHETADREIVGMVRHHHERFDGKGYPGELAGEEIPFLARILAVADAYDAITSDRPYRRASLHRHAVRTILASSGTQFDPPIVQAFLVARLDRLSLAVFAA
ncbi:MAG: HD-GYP domain-containing protein [Candidatus Eisenbacteria bacterium]